MAWLGTAVLALTAAVGATAQAPHAAGSAAAVHMGFLKTPSRSIYCDYLYGGTTESFRYVRCGYKGSLMPVEKKPLGGCGVTDYVGNRVILHQTGFGRTQPCAGDAGPFANPNGAHTVPYGKTWHGGPFKCKSSRSGMTCRNPGGHGFFLAHQHWRVF
jgi:hypothetical protein